MNNIYSKMQKARCEFQEKPLKKSSCCCAFCGANEELKDVKGIRVCGPCVEEIKEGVFFDALVLLE